MLIYLIAQPSVYMSILQPMFQGIGLSATVLFVTAISNGLSSYLLPNGQTLEEAVKGRVGSQ